MNKTILIGRLVRDPETRSTSNSNVCNFTLAVDRRFKNANGERQADFINCVAWKQTADFISRYFGKGSKIAVVGSIQTSSWDDNEGKKQYKTEVVVEEAYFTESKGDQKSKHTPSYEQEMINADDTVLPFDV